MSIPRHSGTPSASSASYSDIFPLSSPEWSDLQVPANALRLSGTKPPEWTAYKGGQVLAFSDEGVQANEEIIYFNAQMPSSYVEGSGLECHIHWLGEDGTAGDVVWRFTYSWANVGDTFPGETIGNTVVSNGLADVLLENDIATINGAGKKIQSMLLCSLRRNSSNASDTLGGKDAYLVEVDFHLQVNTLGSQSRNIK